jgi:O-antigen/teichoic acid export membrane protein
LASPAREKSPTIGALLSKGSASVLVWQAAAASAALVSTPFTVRLLGPERYGMLVLIGVITNYAGLADLGMGLASTHFASMAFGDSDARREIAVVWTSTLVLAPPIALAALAILLTSDGIATSALNLPMLITQEGARALKVAAFGLLLGGLSGIWNTPQVVRLRMSQCSAIASGSAIIQSLFTPLVLLAGGGLIGAAGTGVMVLFFTLTLHVILAHRSLPGVLSPVVRPDLVRPLLKFGAGAAATTIAYRIITGAERVLLPHFASITTLAHFAVAFAPISIVLGVAHTIRPSLLAGFGRLGSADAASQWKLFRCAIGIGGIAASAILAAACALAGTFFRMWAGKEYEQHSVLPFYILSAGAVFNVMAFVPSALILSRGRMELLIRLYAAEIVPYLILTMYLTVQAGAVGAAAAWSLRAIVDAIAVFFLTRYAAPPTGIAHA